MTYVVTESCIRCKYMDCVEVCPVDCFYEGDTMLAIDPDVCIDCGVYEPECPAEAIKPDTEPGAEVWVAFNRDMCPASGRTAQPKARHRPMRMRGSASRKSLKPSSAHRRRMNSDRHKNLELSPVNVTSRDRQDAESSYVGSWHIPAVTPAAQDGRLPAPKRTVASHPRACL